MGWYARAAAWVVAFTLVSPVWIAGQDAPRASFLAGLGNAYGWIGGQVEGYVARGRISGFVGFGFMPNLVSDEGDGFAGALGARVFSAGARHRGLVEVSLSALSNTVSSTFGGDVLEEDRTYGPGLAVGYQFIGDAGLTIMLTGGVGLADEAFDPEGSRLRPIVGVGVGYTWR